MLALLRVAASELRAEVTEVTVPTRTRIRTGHGDETNHMTRAVKFAVAPSLDVVLVNYFSRGLGFSQLCRGVLASAPGALSGNDLVRDGNRLPC